MEGEHLTSDWVTVFRRIPDLGWLQVKVCCWHPAVLMPTHPGFNTQKKGRTRRPRVTAGEF